MASVLRKLKTLGCMLLPHGYHELQRQRKSRIILPSNITSLLAANRELAGRHAGERCFILGNGPSAKALDLSKLRGETVVSVSNGYLHSNYADFMPKYHCVPQITYGLMTDEDVVTWFNEMHAHLGGAELFLSTTEAPLVERRKLLQVAKSIISTLQAASRTTRTLRLSIFHSLRQGSNPCRSWP